MSKITTLIEMRQAIEELQARLSAVEQWIAPPELEAPEQSSITLFGAADADDGSKEAERRSTALIIEEHIRNNIAHWKWSRMIDNDVMACPLTASDVAQRLGLDTDQVRMLIKDPSLWLNVIWRRRPLPPGHPEAVRCKVALHVVTADYR